MLLTSALPSLSPDVENTGSIQRLLVVMADVDEDVIPRGPDVGDIDLSDETQDFRLLLNFSCVAVLW